MSVRRVVKTASAVVVALVCSACLAVDPYDKPDIDTVGLFRSGKAALDQTTLAAMPWRQVFSDPLLRLHIVEALHNNLDLRRAIRQIQIAGANFDQARLGLFPSLSAHAEFSYTNQSDNSVNFGSELEDISIPPTTNWELSADASWEADIWGELTSARRAALAGLLESQAARRAVQTQLIADVATGYYQLLALDEQLAVTRRTVKTRRQEVETLEALKKGAIVTEVAVQQAKAARYNAQVMIPQIQQRIHRRENALNRLLGRPSGPIARRTLADQQPIGTLAVGVPAQLLRNRPDVIEAEYGFRRAFELSNNARAQFYPSLTLTAQGGLRSLDAKDLFDPGSIFYNLIAGLTQPLFAQGELRAQLKRRRARQSQALLDLKGTVLQAGVEVSNALSQFQTSKRALALRKQQLDALEHAVDYASKLLQFGESNYTDVLTARQNLLRARLTRIDSRLAQLRAGVNLYHALGGGWDVPVSTSD